MDLQIIRQSLVDQLEGGQAHMTIVDAVKNFPESAMNIIFPKGTYSAWALLEHMRFTQHDILDFMINPHYQEPEWPKDYWPYREDTVTKIEWDKTLQDFFADVKQLQRMAMAQNLDLSAKVPNGSGQTYIREFHLAADHNSYHLGEFAIMRQVMNIWKK